MAQRNIIDDAQSALRDLVGLIPKADREMAMDDIQTLERALYLLAQAIDFKRGIEAKAVHFNDAISRSNGERDLPFSGSF